MARIDNLTNFLTDVADAIRAKTGSSDTISAEDFDTEIENIPSGGGDDWSDIGYSSTPQSIVDAHNYSKKVYNEYRGGDHKISYYTSDVMKKLEICPLINTSNVRSEASSFFQSYIKLSEVPALTFTNPRSYNNMFNGCSALKKVDLSNFTSDRVEGMSNMFSYCSSLETIDLSNLSTAGILNSGTYARIVSMFEYCTSLKNIIFDSNFTVQGIENLASIFRSCTALPSIDLSYWNTSSATTMSTMFSGCSSLETITFGNNWSFENITSIQGMFESCKKLDNDTLNQILHLCTTVGSSYAGAKTLATLGITSSFVNYANIPNLSNYQDFLDAGWTIS